MRQKNYIFYTSICQGNLLKSITELFVNLFTTKDCILELLENGIKSGCTDKENNVLMKLILPRDKLVEYYSQENMTIGIRMKQFLSLIKDVKKKDSLTLFISKDHPTKFGIQVISGNTKNGQKKTSISYIGFYNADGAKEIHMSEKTYQHPILIPSSEFQRTCKQILSLKKSKYITINQQSSYYISFFVDDGDITCKEIGYGDKDEDKPMDYTKNFQVDNITQLVKMCQLAQNSNIGISYSSDIYIEDKKQNMPLRFKVEFSIGTVTIFVKDYDNYDAKKFKL